MTKKFYLATINGERFTGLNFCIFIYIIQALYNGVVKCFKHKTPQKFFCETTLLGGIRETLAQQIFLYLWYVLSIIFISLPFYF